MIRYALACDHQHEFEGWFGSSDDFDAQQAKGQISCPVCASAQVRKQLMTPAVAGTKRKPQAVDPAQMQAAMGEALGRVRRHVEENFDDVGEDFAREARAIHEGKAEERGIYGQASPAEVRDLVEDGVPVAPLPPEPIKKSDLN
jgi:hypothetical protein